MTTTETPEIAHPYTAPEGTLPLLAGVLAQLHFVHRDMLALVRDLPPNALMWRPGPAMGSIAGIVRHTLYWEKYVMLAASGADTTFDEAYDMPLWDTTDDAPALAAYIVEADEVAKRGLPPLTVADLGGEIASAWGDEGTEGVGEMIADALTHTAMHWGHMQMTRQLWRAQHPEFADAYTRW